MMQRFLPKVKEGDKRILLVDGEAIGAVNRIPKIGIDIFIPPNYSINNYFQFSNLAKQCLMIIINKTDYPFQSIQA